MRPKKRHSNVALTGNQNRYLGNLRATNRLKNNLIGYELVAHACKIVCLLQSL